MRYPGSPIVRVLPELIQLIANCSSLHCEEPKNNHLNRYIHIFIDKVCDWILEDLCITNIY